MKCQSDMLIEAGHPTAMISQEAANARLNTTTAAHIQRD